MKKITIALIMVISLVAPIQTMAKIVAHNSANGAFGTEYSKSLLRLLLNRIQ